MLWDSKFFNNLKSEYSLVIKQLVMPKCLCNLLDVSNNYYFIIFINGTWQLYLI